MLQRRIISVSLTKAAENLKVGRSTLYRWLGDKRIAAVKEEGNWKIFLLQMQSEDSLLFFTLPYSALPELLGEHHKIMTREG